MECAGVPTPSWRTTCATCSRSTGPGAGKRGGGGGALGMSSGSSGGASSIGNGSRRQRLQVRKEPRGRGRAQQQRGACMRMRGRHAPFACWLSARIEHAAECPGSAAEEPPMWERGGRGGPGRQAGRQQCVCVCVCVAWVWGGGPGGGVDGHHSVLTLVRAPLLGNLLDLVVQLEDRLAEALDLVGDVLTLLLLRGGGGG